MFPTEHVCSAMEDEIFCCAVIGDTHKYIIYSDLTGRFPIQSYDGMKYIFVAYVYKLNAILLRSMKFSEMPAWWKHSPAFTHNWKQQDTSQNSTSSTMNAPALFKNS